MAINETVIALKIPRGYADRETAPSMREFGVEEVLVDVDMDVLGRIYINPLLSQDEVVRVLTEAIKIIRNPAAWEYVQRQLADREPRA
jgi:hypothetical protein